MFLELNSAFLFCPKPKISHSKDFPRTFHLINLGIYNKIKTVDKDSFTHILTIAFESRILHKTRFKNCALSDLCICYNLP